jgi:hypothetical protein
VASTPPSTFGPPSLWLLVDIEFVEGKIDGPEAVEAWEGAIKDALRTDDHWPSIFDALYFPIAQRRARGEATHTNIECAGIVISPAPSQGGRTANVELKFLGDAHRFAPRVLHALSERLSSNKGVGVRAARGVISRLRVWSVSDWSDVRMPLPMEQDAFVNLLKPPAELGGWRGNDGGAADGRRIVMIRTTSRWILRSDGKSLHQPPTFEQLLNLAANRICRVQAAWGNGDPVLNHGDLGDHDMRLVACEWKRVSKSLGSGRRSARYPADGHAGCLSFEGNAAPAKIELLHAARFFHVGQRTTLGLGGYDIHVEPLGRGATSARLPSRRAADNVGSRRG